MKSFTVVGIKAGFPAGALLALTSEQARRRFHRTRAITDAEAQAAEAEGVDPAALKGLIPVYCESNVEFKRGETVVCLLECGVNKTQLVELAPSNSASAKQARNEVKARNKAAAAKRREAKKKAAADEARRKEIKAGGVKKPAPAETEDKTSAGLMDSEKAGDADRGKAASVSAGTVDDPAARGEG